LGVFRPFSRKNEQYIEDRESFSTKIVLKITKRESFLGNAKVSAFKVQPRISSLAQLHLLT